jgi:hypothetical protein
MLEPFAIRAMRIDSPGVRVLEVNAAPGREAYTELEARLIDFENRDLTASRPYAALRNPSFEPLEGAPPIAGWRATNASAIVELDQANVRDGAASVHLRSDRGPVALESDPFPMPPTGQLALTMLVRGQKMAPGSELRLAVESIRPGHRYRRAQPISAASAGGSDSAMANQWTAKAILVNDLPLEVGGDIRVRIEMTGPGEVWLDAINAYDLLFPLEWYKFGEAERLQLIHLKHGAKRASEEGRVVDCARVLETYWPRFVAEYAPPPQVAARPVATPGKPSPSQPDQHQQPTPGISERIKRVFPGFK